MPVGLLRVPLPKQFDSVREAEGIIAHALEAANTLVHSVNKYTFEEVGDRRTEVGIGGLKADQACQTR